MKFARKPLAAEAEQGVSGGGEATAQAAVAEDRGAESDGSDMYQEDSDDEDAYHRGVGGGEGNELANPRELLAATAALDVRSSRAGSSGGMNIPGLKLGGIGGMDDEDATPLSSTDRRSVRQTPSRLSRMRMDVLGSMTPRSG